MPLGTKTTIRNIAYAFSAQGLTVLLSILMSLIVPKMLGVDNFAYWQLFVFYITYVGFFHFGLMDGFYLRFGGCRNEELDYASLKGQMLLMLIVQGVLAAVVAVAGVFVGGPRGFVLVCTAVFILISNLNGYLGYILQTINEVRRFSLSLMVDKGLFLVALLTMVVWRTKHFEPIILLYMGAKLISTIYLMHHTQTLLGAKCSILSAAFREAWKNIRVGISLLLSNIASLVIIGFSRQMIDTVWGITAFGIFSFALTLVNFFMQFIGQVSMVLFPALRQTSMNAQNAVYRAMRDALGLILPAVYLVYIPVRLLLISWLPQYAESLQAMILMLPVCIYDGKMNMLCSTYFKVLRKERLLLIINLTSMLASILLCITTVYWVKNIYAVVLSSVVVIAGRSIFAETKLASIFGTHVSIKLVQESVLAVIFMLSAWFLPPMAALIAYLVAYTVYLIVNKTNLASLGVRLHKLLRYGM